MAKVNFGTVVNDARGKIAGIVLSKNKSGAYVRTKVTPANPRTAAQQAVRANFASLSQAWSGTLTQAQRDAWTAYATTFPRTNIFGNSLVLNGLNMYCALGAIMMQLGMPPSLVPPASPAVSPAAWLSTFATATVSALTITETAVSTDATAYNYVFATRSLPAGRSASPSDYRLTYLNADLVAPGPITIGPNYLGIFGAPTVGNKIYALIATVDGTYGTISTAQPVSGIVT